MGKMELLLFGIAAAAVLFMRRTVAETLTPNKLYADSENEDFKPAPIFASREVAPIFPSGEFSPILDIPIKDYYGGGGDGNNTRGDNVGTDLLGDATVAARNLSYGLIGAAFAASPFGLPDSLKGTPAQDFHDSLSMLPNAVTAMMNAPVTFMNFITDRAGKDAPALSSDSATDSSADGRAGDGLRGNTPDGNAPDGDGHGGNGPGRGDGQGRGPGGMF